MNIIKKLFLGDNICTADLSESALRRRWNNLKIIWNTNDSGFERIVRLFLALSQFIFVGTYVRQIFGFRSSVYRDMAIDFLVFFKIAFSLVVLKYDLYNYVAIECVMLWFMFETILYIPTLIFASDHLARPRSYKRGMLLFFLNYIEINCSFAVLYSIGNCLSKTVSHINALYFTFVASSSTGFGDIYPVTTYGQLIFIVHSMTSLMFIVLFLNVFSNKMEVKGYFDNTDKEHI